MSVKAMEITNILSITICPRKYKPTLFSCTILHARVAGYHDHLDHEAVATLSDHVDDLPVTHFNHILTIDLDAE